MRPYGAIRAASSAAAARGSSAAQTALITATASAPAASTAPMFDALMPPIATTGTRRPELAEGSTAVFTSRTRCTLAARVRSGPLDVVGKTLPIAT